MGSRQCKTCESAFIQRGGDPTLRSDECMRCELERLRAEAERQRSGIADLRAGLLRGLKPGDGTEPEPLTEVSGVVACLDALTREGGNREPQVGSMFDEGLEEAGELVRCHVCDRLTVPGLCHVPAPTREDGEGS